MIQNKFCKNWPCNCSFLFSRRSGKWSIELRFFFSNFFFGKQDYEFRVQGLWDEVLSCDFFQKIKVDCDENFFFKTKEWILRIPKNKSWSWWFEIKFVKTGTCNSPFSSRDATPKNWYMQHPFFIQRCYT